MSVGVSLKPVGQLSPDAVSAYVDVSSIGTVRGNSVLSSDGNWLVVPVTTTTNVVAVAVYHLSPEGWVVSTVLYPSVEETGNSFGNAIAINATGDIIVVGAPDATVSAGIWSTNPQAHAGDLHYYQRTNDTWSQGARFWLPGSYPSVAKNFGASLNISSDGKFVIIGQPFSCNSEKGVNLQSNAWLMMQVSGNTFKMVRRFTGPSQRECHYGNFVKISADGASVLCSNFYANSNTGEQYALVDEWKLNPSNIWELKASVPIMAGLLTLNQVSGQISLSELFKQGSLAFAF